MKTSIVIVVVALVLASACTGSNGSAGSSCSPEGATRSPAPLGTGWSHMLMCQGGKWQELEIAPLPQPPLDVPTATTSSSATVPTSQVATSASAVSSSGVATKVERAWEARKDGQRVLRISDTPGALVDSNAPPPVPGQSPPKSAFLSATCTGSPMVCSSAGALLRGSHSVDDLLAKLRRDGFDVKELPPGSP